MKTFLSIILGFLIGILSNTFFNSFKMTTERTLIVSIIALIIAGCIIYLENKERKTKEKYRQNSEKAQLIERFTDYKYSHHIPSPQFLQSLFSAKGFCQTGDLYFLEKIKRHFTQDQIFKLHCWGKIHRDEYNFLYPRL